MKEILSQAEIDSLITSLASGDINFDDIKDASAEKDIHAYDFKRPNKFSKEHLRTLQMIHDNFGRILSNFLAAYLRANVQIRVASVDQLTYEDFIKSIPSPTLMTVFSIEPLKGTAVLETNPQFLFPVIDLLFGGPGETPKKVRELTEIELSVLRKLNGKIMENLALAWADIFEIKPVLESLETNPRFNQSITPNETVAVITLATFVGQSKGLINLCLPFMTLDPLISKLSAHYWFTHEQQDGGGIEQKALEYLLKTVPIKLTASVGETTITVQDFLQLQEGDIITLDKFISEELDLYVEEEIKFKVQPGITPNKRMGAQITDLVRDEEEEDGE